MARVRGRLTQQELEKIVGEGVDLDGKKAKFSDVIVVEREGSAANHWVEVGIEEGRNREVRRIFEALGHSVSRLKRISYGDVSMMPNLRLGHAKEMAPLQVEKMLKNLDLVDFVAKVRPHKEPEQAKRKPRKQHVRGSKEAEAKSLSDRLSHKERQDRNKKYRVEQRKERQSERSSKSKDQNKGRSKTNKSSRFKTKPARKAR